MTHNEVKLTLFVKSHTMAVILAVVGFILIIRAFIAGEIPDGIGIGRGLSLPSPAEWLAGHPAESFGLNLVALILTATMMIWLNSAFNILRSYSVTFVGLFIVMTAAMPVEACAFNGASILALTIMTATGIIISTYSSPALSKRIFLIFMLISAGALIQAAFVPYIAVFFIAMAQMRVIRARTITAAILGIVTPVWLLWAFGPWEWPHFTMPQFTDIYSSLPTDRIILMWCSVGLSLVSGTVLGTINLIKIFSYNAKARAINGLLTAVAVTTAILCFADYTNMPVYIILLNACTAFQAGHFTAIYERKRGYLPMLILPVLYTAIALAPVFMP